MFVFFDTETTGLSRQADRIVQIAWAITNRDGEILAENNYIIKPDGYEIPIFATRIHGISTEMAHSKGVYIDEALRGFCNDIEYVSLLVAHNIDFDIGMLHEELKRCNIKVDTSGLHKLCTMKLSTNWCRIPKFNGTRGFKWPNLTELHYKLFGTDFASAHDALADVHAARRCFFELLNRSVIVIPDILRLYSPENEVRLHRSNVGDLKFSRASTRADLFSVVEAAKQTRPEVRHDSSSSAPLAPQRDLPPELERSGPFAEIKATEAFRIQSRPAPTVSLLTSPPIKCKQPGPFPTDNAACARRTAAEQGDVDAQYELARMCDTGRGVPKDFTEAARWYRKAAEQGNSHAQLNLGVMCLNGQGVPQDDLEAVRWLRMSANSGNADAQYELWLMFDTDRAKPLNDTEAARFCRAAAEQGDVAAQYRLSMMFSNGRGVPEDIIEAARWHRMAAEHGHADAQYELWNVHGGSTKTFTDDLRWLRMAAEQGHADAQCDLGLVFFNGEEIPQDYDEAARWLRLAAEKGVYAEEDQLGIALYEIGRCAPQHSAEAVRWFRLAAEEGNDAAQYQLGVTFLYGRGVTEDFAEAARWLRMAAEQGHADAQYELSQMYYVGRGVIQDKVEAARLLRIAAEQDNPDAQFEVGRMYDTGSGERQNGFEAVRWYRRAARQGHRVAKEKLSTAGYAVD